MNKTLLSLLMMATISCLTITAHAQSNHAVHAGIGYLDFQWEEFDDEDGRIKLTEESSLANLNVGYNYRGDFVVNYDYAAEDADYLGESLGGGDRAPTITEYEFHNIEMEYGRSFLVFQYKTRISGLAGYHTRNRDINPFEGENSGLDEKISFSYAGIKADTEILKFDTISWIIGAQYDRSFNGENNVFQYSTAANGTEADINVDLEPLVSKSFYTIITANLAPDWTLALSYEYQFKEMARSDTGQATFFLPGGGTSKGKAFNQPKSEQKTTLIELSLQKSF